MRSLENLIQIFRSLDLLLNLGPGALLQHPVALQQPDESITCIFFEKGTERKPILLLSPKYELTIMKISLTENAAKQINLQLKKRGQGIGLRLGIKKSGCSGYSYVLDYADDLLSADIVHEQHGVKVVINEADQSVLDGIELDYAKEGINAAFKFNNPNVTDTCGCGESFAVNS